MYRLLAPLVVYRPLAKFFRDRGPHLAAMIAYFALLSFVPLTFLALSLLGLTGRADESSYLVTELKKVFPGTSVSAIVKAVRSVQDNAATLGIIGGIALLWTSLLMPAPVSVTDSSTYWPAVTSGCARQ